LLWVRSWSWSTGACVRDGRFVGCTCQGWWTASGGPAGLPLACLRRAVVLHPDTRQSRCYAAAILLWTWATLKRCQVCGRPTCVQVCCGMCAAAWHYPMSGMGTVCRIQVVQGLVRISCAVDGRLGCPMCCCISAASSARAVCCKLLGVVLWWVLRVAALDS
jgi:hypothetical protein